MTLKSEFLIYAVIGIVAFCIFANTLGHGFVYDDNRQILRNPLIQRSQLYGKAMTSDVWAFKGGGDIAASNYFRPTFVAWMIVNWRLFESSASGWHFTVILYTQNKKQEALAELEAVPTRARNEFLIDSKAVFLRLGMLYAERGRKSEAKGAFEEYLATTADIGDATLIEDRRRAAELLRQVSTP